MAVVFIIFFALSSLIASFAGQLFSDCLWWWLPLLASTTLATQTRSGAWRLVVAWGACVWGSWHGAPSPDGSLPHAQVLESQPWTLWRKTVLIRHEGRVFMVKRSLWRSDAQLGKVVCRRESMLWHTRRCWLKPFSSQANPATSFVERVNFAHYRSWMAARLKSPLIPWYEALLFGVADDVPYREQRALRDLGLIHAISVSGFHFSALGAVLVFLTTWPLRVLWTLRLVSHRVLVVNHWFGSALALVLMVAFAMFIQWPPPCQRALLFFALHLALNGLASGIPMTRRMTWVMALQMLIFPLDVWDISNMLSWLAYVLVIDYVHGVKAMSKSEALGRLLAFQVKVSLTAAAFFSQWSLGGILANVVLACCLGPIFLAFAATFAAKMMVFPSWIWEPLEKLLLILPRALASLDRSAYLRGLTLRLDQIPVWEPEAWRCLACLLMLVLALRAWRRLSLVSG